MESMTVLKNRFTSQRYNAQSANPNACRSPTSSLKSEANRGENDRKTQHWEELECALPPPGDR